MIEHKSSLTRGSFHYFEDGKEAGVMTYTKAGEDMIIIDHTEVFPEFNGKGIGKKLVLEGVKYARENKLKILPLCPFAKALFMKLPEIQDVLA